MVVIPAGESVSFDSEGPQRKVSIAQPFAVGRFEVTFDEWDACVATNGCKHKPRDQGWGRGKRPVIDVSWENISHEYLPWLAKKTGKTYRLLTEAEWEYAARAGSRAQYTWGDEVGKNRANCNGCGSQWDNKQTAPVGSFQANAFGLHDVHGNVSEWVSDCYGRYGSIAACLRGSSFEAILAPKGAQGYPVALARLSYGFSGVGFRVARALD